MLSCDKTISGGEKNSFTTNYNQSSPYQNLYNVSQLLTNGNQASSQYQYPSISSNQVSHTSMQSLQYYNQQQAVKHNQQYQQLQPQYLNANSLHNTQAPVYLNTNTSFINQIPQQPSNYILAYQAANNYKQQQQYQQLSQFNNLQYNQNITLNTLGTDIRDIDKRNLKNHSFFQHQPNSSISTIESSFDNNPLLSNNSCKNSPSSRPRLMRTDPKPVPTFDSDSNQQQEASSTSPSSSSSSSQHIESKSKTNSNKTFRSLFGHLVFGSDVPFPYTIILVAFLITIIAATSIITILTVFLTVTGYTAHPLTESTFNTSLIVGVVCASFALILVTVSLLIWRKHCQAAYYYLDDPQSPSRGTNSPQLSETYDDSEYGSVPVNEWSKHVQKLHSDGDIGFSREFERIQQASNLNLSYDHSQLLENKHKNRYINIVAYDHTRVMLKTLPGQKKPGSDYINANFIDVSTLTADNIIKLKLVSYLFG